MIKNSNSILTLCLAVLFLLPGNVFAGPFGLFKRHRAKSNCCQTSPVATSGVYSVATDGIAREYGPTYACQAFVDCDDGRTIPGELCTGSDCEAVKEAAIESAENAVPDDCEISFTDVGCNPTCPDPEEEYTMYVGSTGECLYEVTYKICCCNGVVIDQPMRGRTLAAAKTKAKIFACNLASLYCDGRIRWAKWKCRRVPAPAPVAQPCCN